MSSKNLPVLAVRINSFVEVANTYDAIDAISRHFPDNPIVTVSAPESEALSTIQKDSRIETVYIFRPSGHSAFQKIASLLRSLLKLKPLRATVICYGSTPGEYYSRHIVTGLIFGGTKYLIGPDLRLVPLLSQEGFRAVSNAAQRISADFFTTSYLKHRYSRSPAKRQLTSHTLVSNDNVLFVALFRIGDIVAILPIIQAASESIGGKVDMLVPEHIAMLLEPIAFIRKIFTFKHPVIRGVDGETLRLIGKLRQQKYDVAIEMAGNHITPRLFSYTSGAPFIIGLCEQNDNFKRTGFDLLDAKIIPFLDGDGYTSRAMRISRELGVDSHLTDFRFEPSAASVARVDELLIRNEVPQRYAALHVVASSLDKSWSNDRFAEIGDYLIVNYDLDIVLTGSSDDRRLVDGLKSLSRHANRLHNLAGEVAIEDLPALYERAVIVVSVDTGPAHIAGATRTRLVVLGNFSPYGRDLSLVKPDETLPREHPSRPYDTITVARVIEAIDKAMLDDV